MYADVVFHRLLDALGGGEDDITLNIRLESEKTYFESHIKVHIRDKQPRGWLDASLIDTLLLLTHGDEGDELEFHFDKPDSIGGFLSATVRNHHGDKLLLLNYNMRPYENFVIDWSLLYTFFVSLRFDSGTFIVKTTDAKEFLRSDPKEWIDRIIQWRLESLLDGSQDMISEEFLMDEPLRGWLDMVKSNTKVIRYEKISDILVKIRHDVFDKIAYMDKDIRTMTSVPYSYTVHAPTMTICESIVAIQSLCYDGLTARFEGDRFFLPNGVIKEASPYSILQMMFYHLSGDIIDTTVLRCLCTSEDIVMSWYSVMYFDPYSKRILERKNILRNAFLMAHYAYNREVWKDTPSEVKSNRMRI